MELAFTLAADHLVATWGPLQCKASKSYSKNWLIQLIFMWAHDLSVLLGLRGIKDTTSSFRSGVIYLGVKLRTKN